MNDTGRRILLNCDMGESFGAWRMGDDVHSMPLVDQANLACGFHAGDPLPCGARWSWRYAMA